MYPPLQWWKPSTFTLGPQEGVFLNPFGHLVAGAVLWVAKVVVQRYEGDKTFLEEVYRLDGRAGVNVKSRRHGPDIVKPDLHLRVTPPG